MAKHTVIMLQQTYIFPMPVVCLDDSGLTRQYILPRVSDCSQPGLLTDPCDNWNEVRCAADPPYFNPVVDTDRLWFQLRLPDPINDWPESGGPQPQGSGWQEGYGGLINAFAIDYCTGAEVLLEPSNIESAWVGLLRSEDQPGGQPVQTIGIKPAGLPEYFIIRFEHVTQGSFYSQVYKREQCGGTVLFEGIYESIEACTEGDEAPTCYETDCVGNIYGWDANSPYYAAFGDLLTYRDRLRVYGSVEHVSTANERDTNAQGVQFGIVVTETWRFRSVALPPYVVERLQNLLAADALAVDGDSNSIWQAPDELAKNNEGGSTWLLDTTLRRVVCERQRGCV